MQQGTHGTQQCALGFAHAYRHTQNKAQLPSGNTLRMGWLIPWSVATCAAMSCTWVQGTGSAGTTANTRAAGAGRGPPASTWLRRTGHCDACCCPQTCRACRRCGCPGGDQGVCSPLALSFWRSFLSVEESRVASSLRPQCVPSPRHFHTGSARDGGQHAASVTDGRRRARHGGRRGASFHVW